jgi:glycosyltransferase involved in cell wall biosynthesis
MNRMHLLLIPSERYLPADDPLAGIFQHDQAVAMSRSGIRTAILSVELRSPVLLKRRLTGWPSGQAVSVEDGLPVYRQHGWFRTPLWRRGYLRQYLHDGLRLFERYLDEQGRPDLIHSHNALRAGVLAAEIKKRYGIPYIVTEHSSDYSRGTVHTADLGWIRQAYTGAARRLVVSSSLGRLLEHQFGDSFGAWQVMPNMLDPVFEQIELPLARNRNNGFTFLNVGGLVEVKRQDLLIAAFALAFRGRQDVCLRIVGDGPRRGELEKIIRETSLAEQVTFTGRLDRTGVCREMQNCDAYVHSSSSETFGVAIIEALSCGKPVVSTACGGPDDLVSEDNGRLVAVGDVAALAGAMGDVREQVDSYDAVRIRVACLDRFSQQSVCDSLLKVYGEVLQETRRV